MKLILLYFTGLYNMQLKEYKGVKAMVFPHMYGCESWTIKKGECQRIDAFELWCWRRLLFIGRTDVEAETPILWPPDEKS